MPRNVSLPIHFLFRQLISNTLLILTPQMAAFASFGTTKRGPLVTSSLKAPIFHWAPSPTSFFREDKPFADLAALLTTLRGAVAGREARLWGELRLCTRARADREGAGWALQQSPADPRFHPKQRGEEVGLLFRAEPPRRPWRARGREPGAEPLSQADGRPDGEGRGQGSPGRRAALDSGEGAARGRARCHRRGLQPRGCT